MPYKNPEDTRACARRAWARTDVDSPRVKRLAKTYNVSPETIHELIHRPACDACGRSVSDLGNHAFRSLHIDHDHTTGQIRGVLCPWCNMIVGLAYDDPNRLRQLADWLEGVMIAHEGR